MRDLDLIIAIFILCGVEFADVRDTTGLPFAVSSPLLNHGPHWHILIDANGKCRPIEFRKPEVVHAFGRPCAVCDVREARGRGRRCRTDAE
jgi:hypothetical protein